jgi:uncharacterized protein
MSLMSTPRILDSDGHVREDDDQIMKFLPDAYRRTNDLGIRMIFPPLSHFHGLTTIEVPPERANRPPVGPSEWIDFLEDVGIETTVLYPTTGLAYGKITNPKYAIAACRAYNDWLAETYMAKSPRFQGVALIPMQEPEAAAEELRRIVKDLGMCAAMLPAIGLKNHVGDRDYWPVYREAEQLGCSLSIHGGPHTGLGFDHMNVFAAFHAMGHPFSVMINFAGMIFNGVFDEFPNLRVAYLEAGVSWLLMMMERCHGSGAAFPPYDPEGVLVKLQPGEKMSGYIRRKIREGQIFVGVEGDEPELPYAVKLLGADPFLYSSDFPHEVTNETCKEEIEELLENEELTQSDKEAILFNNGQRFYQVKVAVA